MDFHEQFDYLAVGHICKDKLPNGYRIGGAAAYAGALARAAGCRTAIVTRSSSDDDLQQQLPGIEIYQRPSEKTTIFENSYTSEGRKQTIHSRAGDIGIQDIPAAWQRASIVHLAPIANEVDPQIIGLFSNSIVGLAPQGWMRHWDEQGQVFMTSWPEAEIYLRLATVVFVSDEDLTNELMLKNYREWSRMLVMTQGGDGCTLFLKEEAHYFPVEAGSVVDTTGAGDIFAGAFLIRLLQTDGNPFEAARFANRIAALSVSVAGLEAKVQVIMRHGFQ